MNADSIRDIREWLTPGEILYHYPLTIFNVRYGRGYFAVAKSVDLIGDDAQGGDIEYINYWREEDEDIEKYHTLPYGRGLTIDEAIADLEEKLRCQIAWLEERERQWNSPENAEARRRHEEFLKSIKPLKSASAVRDTIDLSTGEGKVKRKED